MMNVIKTIERPVTNFFNPISGTQEEENIITYILEFKTEDEAEEFDDEISGVSGEFYEGPGHTEAYLNFRIVQVVPIIRTEDTELEDNKVILIQNTTLEALSVIEKRKAYLWLFQYIAGQTK